MKKRLNNKAMNLTSYEQNILLPVLIKGLEAKRGHANAVTCSQIVDSLQKKGLKIGYTSMYKLVNHIRTNDLILGLTASCSGFYVSSSEKDLVKYENALLGREKAIRKVRMSIKRQREMLLSQNYQRQSPLF